MNGLIETEDCKSSARRLTDAIGAFLLATFEIEHRYTNEVAEALYQYLTVGVRAAEAMAKTNPAMFAPYNPPPLVEQLTRLIEQRDAVQEKLDETEAKMNDHELPDVVRTPLEIGYLGPLRDQLRFLEKEIASLTARIEQSGTSEPCPVPTDLSGHGNQS